MIPPKIAPTTLLERKDALDDLLIHAMGQIDAVVAHVAASREAGKKEFKAVRAMCIAAMTHCNAVLETLAVYPPVTSQQHQAKEVFEEYRRRSFDRNPLSETKVNDKVLLFVQDTLELLRVLRAVLLGLPKERKTMVRLYRQRSPIPSRAAFAHELENGR